jgi:hypothetical protein
MFYGAIDGFAVQHVKFDSRTMKGGLVDLRPPQSPAENSPPLRHHRPCAGDPDS